MLKEQPYRSLFLAGPSRADVGDTCLDSPMWSTVKFFGGFTFAFNARPTKHMILAIKIERFRVERINGGGWKLRRSGVNPREKLTGRTPFVSLMRVWNECGCLEDASVEKKPTPYENRNTARRVCRRIVDTGANYPENLAAVEKRKSRGKARRWVHIPCVTIIHACIK